MSDANPPQTRTRKPTRRFHQARATLLMLILSAGMMAYTSLQVTQHPQRFPAAQVGASGQSQTGGLDATTPSAQTAQGDQK